MFKKKEKMKPDNNESNNHLGGKESTEDLIKEAINEASVNDNTSANSDMKKDVKVEVKSDVKSNVKKTPSSDEQVSELTSHLQHLQAEFENFKKRTERECVLYKEYANVELLRKFLTLIDNFEIALQNQDNHKEFVKGIEMIYSEFHSMIEKEGVKRINAKGHPLNPELHDVLLQQESDEPEGSIIEELQPGYMYKNRVLRHTKVKIAKKKQGNDNKDAKK